MQRDVMAYDLDYFELVQEAKHLPPDAGLPRLRMALMGDAATQQFVPLLRVLFRHHGIAVETYECPFDAAELEALNPQSGLYASKPDVVVLINAIQALRMRFYTRQLSEAHWMESERKRIIRVWNALRENSSALVIQSNFALPIERFFGNFDHKIPVSFYTLVQKLNGFIAEIAADYRNVLVNDVESIAAWVGRRSWFDERLWNLAKTFCALEHLPLVARNIVDITMATKGRGVKCVVLDLDNTLWGGVVGDDGPHGIQICAHGDGEAFYQFQCYLRELKRRGILLAVCSKNEHANAVRPFHENPEMVLKFDDMTVFVANWNDKASNIRAIREALNIGLDSMVFIDDNPFERNLVRDLIPEVIVPELPEDPSEYVKALSELNLFETTSFSAEDVQRSDLYKQEAQRQLLEHSASSFDEFLQSLDMRIEVSRFKPEQLPRIAQLMQRSNQFNLTTRRLSEAQCEQLMQDEENWIPLYAKLRDRFGDHGLISIVIASPNAAESTLDITDWLMSCRVLTRGVEEFLMTYLASEARKRGLERMRGAYVPTAKNGMVKEFYGRFGFVKVSEEGNGSSRWVLELAKYSPARVFIREEEVQESAFSTAV
jgi:FkbH-like protein